MRLKKISLENWKNFRKIDVPIGDRLFVVGANAAGKSNFLDALRFMRDIVKHGGGLQYAISERGGLSKIRCLSARANPHIGITLEFADDQNATWLYTLSIVQQQTGTHKALIARESITKDSISIFFRPNDEDKKDEERLSQTHLEQISTNKDFREIVYFLESIRYMHLVPQLLKFPAAFSGPDLPEDYFGKGFLKTIAKTPEKTRKARLSNIEKVLKVAVPQLKDLIYTDDAGQPHLEVTYKHWRSRGAKQSETQLSDGTLRFIGLLWTLLDGQGLLLLEEPELSLHVAIVEKLPELLYTVQRSKKRLKRQIILTTHSADLLSNTSISLSQILLLQPGNEGTAAELAQNYPDVRALLEGGATPAECIRSHTMPDVYQGLLLFE